MLCQDYVILFWQMIWKILDASEDASIPRESESLPANLAAGHGMRAHGFNTLASHAGVDPDGMKWWKNEVNGLKKACKYHLC